MRLIQPINLALPLIVGALTLCYTPPGLADTTTRATAATNDVAFDPSGERVATVTTDNQVAIYSVVTGERLTTFAAQDGYMSEIDWTSDGERIATVSQAGTISLVEIGTGRTLWASGDFSDASFRIDGGLAQVEIAPHGRTVAALQTFPESIVSIWDLDDGSLRKEIRLDTLTDVFVWSPDGESLITANHNGNVVIVSAADGTVKETFELDLGRVIDIDQGTDDTLALGGAKGVVTLIDTNTGEPQKQFDHGAFINRVAVSNEKDLVAAVGGLGYLKAWRAGSGELLFSARAHDDIAYYVSSHPKSDLLATVGEDNFVRFWDPETGEQLLEIRG